MIAHCFQRESEENEEYMQGSLTGEKKNGGSLERSHLWYFQNILTILPFFTPLLDFNMCSDLF